LQRGAQPALGAHRVAGPRRGSAEALARWLGRFGANLDEDRSARPRRDLEGEFRAVVCERSGHVGEGDGRFADKSVQSFVTETHRTLGGFCLMRVAAPAARRTAHLEHVAEVGCELEAQGNGQLPAPVIGDRDAFVKPFLPQEAAALDMDHPVWHPIERMPAVAEIGGEKDIVLRERSAEQRRLLARHLQPEQRQDTRVVDEQPVADAANVAMRIGDDEAVLMLQGELAMRLARAGVVECRQCHGWIQLPFVDALRLCHHSISRLTLMPRQ
jgi:hypothetical protein